jgi:HK97 family phage portal protein
MGIRDWIGKRFSLRDPKPWTAIHGGDTWAGEHVTPNRALQLSAFWAAVRLISQTVGTLPLGVYERGDDGSKRARSDHPLYAVLHDSPNSDQTAVEYWESVVLALCLHGNSISEKVTSGSRVVALQPLPDAVPYRTTDGELQYRFTDRGKAQDVPEEAIFHVKGFGPPGDLGLSPVAFARQTLSLAIATETAAGATYSNGFRPSGFFVSPEVLDEEQRKQATKALVDPYKGARNRGHVGILEGNFKFEPTSISPEDAELILSRKFNVEEVCRWLGVPPILIGHSAEGQTMWGSGVEQIMLGWLTLGLRPYLSRIEQAIRKRLIALAERGTIFAEFAVEGLLRADSKTCAAFEAQMVQNGIYTRNYARALENLPPLPGGDVLTVQSNLLPIDQLGKVAPTQTPVPAPKEDTDA